MRVRPDLPGELPRPSVVTSAIDIVVYYDGSQIFATKARRVDETTLVIEGENAGLLNHMVVDVELPKWKCSRGRAFPETGRLPARVTRVSPEGVDLELECQATDLPWLATLGPRSR